jgi:hypothetical protein
VINTTRPSYLLIYITLYKVWFRRPSRLQDKTIVNKDSEDKEEGKDSADKEYIFSELYYKVFKNNIKEAEKIVKKGGKKV